VTSRLGTGKPLTFFYSARKGQEFRIREVIDDKKRKVLGREGKTLTLNLGVIPSSQAYFFFGLV
jgi:hypothetical protein